MISFKDNLKNGVAVGEVIAVNSIFCEVRGFRNLKTGSQILFESDSRGFVNEIKDDISKIVLIEDRGIIPGQMALVLKDTLTVSFGLNTLGRVINVFGEPLDGKGKILDTKDLDMFREAPSIIQRDDIQKQIETGNIVVDTLFPLAFGQREVILGDNKTGKTTFLIDLIRNQKDKSIIVYVLIGKTNDQVSSIITSLEESGTLEFSVVLVAKAELLPVESYLSPFAGCSIGEALWSMGKDVIIVYDDLTEHAKSYREISLIEGVFPGKDSYPADVFSLHSRLLERAGRVKNNEGSLTALPIISVQNNDFTGYIPTNVISITDGQLFFDRELFLKGIRPAINTGISVSRIGKRVQEIFMQSISEKLNIALIKYDQAYKFSHFGVNMPPSVLADLDRGEKINILFNQNIGESYTLFEQKVLITVVLSHYMDIKAEDVYKMKRNVKKLRNISDFKEEDVENQELMKFLLS
ncbi:MAG: sodium-transporting two-sector ATPase [Patescibacteria group bacterium]